jgi:hypothetical protein
MGKNVLWVQDLCACVAGVAARLHTMGDGQWVAKTRLPA